MRSYPAEFQVRTCSHPPPCSDAEHAVMRRLDGRVGRGGKANGERIARVDRIQDAVIPQFGGRIVRALLALIGLQHRLTDCGDLLRREYLTLPLHLLDLDIAENVCSLLRSHDRSLRTRPGEEKARIEGTTRHAVDTRAKGAVTVNRELGHACAGNGHDELRAILGDATSLVFLADHEARDVLKEQQRRAVFVTQLDEMCPFQRAVVEQDTVVGEYPDPHSPDTRIAAD